MRRMSSLEREIAFSWSLLCWGLREKRNCVPSGRQSSECSLLCPRVCDLLHCRVSGLELRVLLERMPLPWWWKPLVLKVPLVSQAEANGKAKRQSWNAALLRSRAELHSLFWLRLDYWQWVHWGSSVPSALESCHGSVTAAENYNFGRLWLCCITAFNPRDVLPFGEW